MKKIIIIFVAFCLNLTYAQWDFTLNQSEKILSAIGVFKFNLSEYDTISLNLSKSRKLGIDLAIEGDFFNTSEHYFVLFEIDNRKIKMISSLKEKGKLRLLKLKDIKSKQEFEIIDFLKVIKGGSECILTISSGFKVIQGFNKLIGSEDSINRVLIGNYPY
ncbi:MAG: hypothetical protein VW979_07620 [Flavobacteriaceae bacterium]